MPIITIANGDDWIGIYSDNALVFEGHSIKPRELLELFHRQEIKFFGEFEVSLDWLDSLGHMPAFLKDVQISYMGQDMPFFKYLEKRQEDE